MLKGEDSVTEICHRHQVSATQAYCWRDQYLEGGKKALSDGYDKVLPGDGLSSAVVWVCVVLSIFPPSGYSSIPRFGGSTTL